MRAAVNIGRHVTEVVPVPALSIVADGEDEVVGVGRGRDPAILERDPPHAVVETTVDHPDRTAELPPVEGEVRLARDAGVAAGAGVVRHAGGEVHRGRTGVGGGAAVGDRDDVRRGAGVVVRSGVIHDDGGVGDGGDHVAVRRGTAVHRVGRGRAAGARHEGECRNEEGEKRPHGWLLSRRATTPWRGEELFLLSKMLRS